MHYSEIWKIGIQSKQFKIKWELDDLSISWNSWYEGQAWCSGESCLTESPGRGFKTASPQILWGEGLPRFFPSPDPTHVGASPLLWNSWYVCIGTSRSRHGHSELQWKGRRAKSKKWTSTWVVYKTNRTMQHLFCQETQKDSVREKEKADYQTWTLNWNTNIGQITKKVTSKYW